MDLITKERTVNAMCGHLEKLMKDRKKLEKFKSHEKYETVDKKFEQIASNLVKLIFELYRDEDEAVVRDADSYMKDYEALNQILFFEFDGWMP